jgi:hypothetical protein
MKRIEALRELTRNFGYALRDAQAEGLTRDDAHECLNYALETTPLPDNPPETRAEIEARSPSVQRLLQHVTRLAR